MKKNQIFIIMVVAAMIITALAECHYSNQHSTPAAKDTTAFNPIIQHSEIK